MGWGMGWGMDWGMDWYGGSEDGERLDWLCKRPLLG